MLDTLGQDLRYAVRQLRRSPGFAAVVIVTLALGIGANTAVFSVVDALFLRPPPRVSHPDRLVRIYTSDYNGLRYGVSSYPDFEIFRGRKQFLSGAAAFTPTPVELVSGGRTTRIMSELVSADYFDVLGVRPELGRGFTAAEGHEADPVAVIGHRLWQEQFGGDPDIVGKPIHLNGGTFTVIGVAPSDYAGAMRGIRVGVWIPLRAEPFLTGSQDYIGQPRNRGLFVIGRLRTGVTLPEAQAGFRFVTARLQRTHPDTWGRGNGAGRHITVLPERLARVPMMIRGTAVGLAGLLMGVVGIVLLLCCANVANLLLARGAGRSREFAVRLSLGASRGRLIRQLLTESAVLAGLGGVAGLLLALWAARLLPDLVPPLPVHIYLDLAPDWRVLAFAGAVSVVTTVLFGLAPALRSTRSEVISDLKESRPTGARPRVTLQSVLVVVQVSASLVLLVGAGLFLRSIAAARHADVGLDPRGVVVAGLDLTNRHLSDEERDQLYQRLAREIGRLPDVTGVALGSSVPLSGTSSGTGVGVAGYEPHRGEDMEFHFAAVGANYFHVMRIPLLRGRAFTDDDRRGAPPVAVVNEAFARRFWPAQDPIGKRLTHVDRLRNVDVIGVVPTGKYTSLGEDPTPYIYVSHLQVDRSMKIDIRTSGDPARLVPEARRVIRADEPDLPITDLAPMTDLMAASLLPQRIGSTVLSLFAGVATLLATLGLYGVLTYVVSLRMHEIGVRMALGADRGDVVSLIAGRGLTLACGGLLVGLALAAVLCQFASRFLYGVAALDPVVFGSVILVLAISALLASWIPAQRAASVDVATALWAE